MADFMESASIEQDADVIATIYRDEVHNHETQHKGEAEFNIIKNRHGPIGRINLVWIGEYMRFEDADTKYLYDMASYKERYSK